MGYGVITHTVDVYRLTKTGNNTEYGASAVITGLDCAIYPASTDILAVYPELPAYGSFEVFVYENATLQTGDKLTSGSEEYIVRGVPEVYENNYIYFQRLLAVKET